MNPPSGVAIRPLTPSDQPLLWDVLYLALYVPDGEAPLSRAVVQRPELARYVAGWGRAGDLGFAALDTAAGESIGAAWIRLLSGDNRGYGYVDDATPELSIAVEPAWRGRGIGAALLSRLLHAAQPRYRAISLSVAVDNPAVRLYSRLGFTVVRVEGESLTMLKRLAVSRGPQTGAVSGSPGINPQEAP